MPINKYLKMVLLIITFVITILQPNIAVAIEESISVNKPIRSKSMSQDQPAEKNWGHYSKSKDSVRCFCNWPSCVSTGYMCKSSMGGCFSDLLSHSRSSSYRGRHGCIESLTQSERQKWCEMDSTEVLEDSQGQKPSLKRPKLFLCCYHDMCNHVDSPQTKTLLNSTMNEIMAEETGQKVPNRSEQLLYSNSEVWFRAATIAVPICGAVILFVLIALAIKLLRSENRDNMHRKLGALYVHQVPSSRKVYAEKIDKTYENLLRKQYLPVNNSNMVYVNNEPAPHKFQNLPLLSLQNDIPAVNKNDTNAKLNFIQCDNNYLDPNSISIQMNLEKDKEPIAAQNINSKSAATDDKFCIESDLEPKSVYYRLNN